VADKREDGVVVKKGKDRNGNPSLQISFPRGGVDANIIRALVAEAKTGGIDPLTGFREDDGAANEEAVAALEQFLMSKLRPEALNEILAASASKNVLGGGMKKIAFDLLRDANVGS
jgi:hypothetical protein